VQGIWIEEVKESGLIGKWRMQELRSEGISDGEGSASRDQGNAFLCKLLYG